MEKGLDIIKQDVHRELEEMQLNTLLLSHKILYNSFPSLTKQQLIDKLYKSFPYKRILKHRDYSMTFTPSQTISFEYYQGAGYAKVNLYLRYKKLSESWMVNMDNKIAISPSTFSKKGFQKLLNKTKRKQLSSLKKNLKSTLEQNKYEFKKIKTAITDILHVIYHAQKLKETFYAYRGENNFNLNYGIEENLNKMQLDLETYKTSQMNLQTNNTILLKGFNSFSIAPWVSLGFAGQCCLYRIKITDSVPYFIFSHSDRYKEYEILLPPAMFKVIKVHDIESPLSKFIRMRMYDIEFVKPLLNII